MVTTELFLLAIMLVGLFRLRCHGTGSFALGRLLWKQVRWYQFSYGRAFLLLLI